MEPHAQCPAGGALLPGLACCGLLRQGVGIHGLFGDKLWLKLDTRVTVPNVRNAMILRELDRNKQAVIEKHASIFRPHLWFCGGLMGAGRDMPGGHVSVLSVSATSSHQGLSVLYYDNPMSLRKVSDFCYLCLCMLSNPCTPFLRSRYFNQIVTAVSHPALSIKQAQS